MFEILGATKQQICSKRKTAIMFHYSRDDHKKFLIDCIDIYD